MGWFAARNVYHFGIKDNGLNIFEERIVCFEASNFDEAHAKAAKESKDYAIDHGFDSHSEQELYKQDGELLIDGYELWSVLYESNKSLNEFYEDHYEKYRYNPEVS